MARLPTPGGDDGQWGTILNDFLTQAHDNSGNLKADTVGSTQIQADAIAASHVADGALTQAKIQDLASDLADKVDTTDTRLTADQTGYYPPSGYGLFATSEQITLGQDVSSTGTATLILARIWVPAGNAISSISAIVATAGTLAGGGTNGFAIYTNTGTLVAQTPTNNNQWTSAGWTTATLSSAIASQSTGRFVYTGLLVNGYSGAPDLLWYNCGRTELVGPGIGVTNRRSMYNGGQTSFPASFNPATYGTLNSYIPIIGLA